MGAKLMDKIDTIVRASNLNVQNMTSQLMGDLYTIEMQAAGVPRKKIMEINAAVADSYVEYNRLWNKDREGDKELTYSIEQLERINALLLDDNRQLREAANELLKRQEEEHG